MKLFAHKYKNIGHLQKFCEESIQEHTYASVLALVAYKDGSKKEADEAGDFIQKIIKKAIVVSFGVEAGCMSERLVDKGVFVTFLMTKKASVKAEAIESSKITEEFLNGYRNDELKAAIVFSSVSLPPSYRATHRISLSQY